MILIAHEFVRSKSVKVRDLDSVMFYEEKGYTRGNDCSDGSIRMVKPCEAWVKFETNSKNVYKQNMRSEICRFYGKQELKIERFNMFLVDVLTEKVKVVFDEMGSFRIIKQVKS